MNRYLNYTEREIIEKIGSHSEINSVCYHIMMNMLKLKLYENMIKAINDHTSSTNKLSNQVLYLNIIFGIFTIVGAICSLVAILC